MWGLMPVRKQPPGNSSSNLARSRKTDARRYELPGAEPRENQDHSARTAMVRAPDRLFAYAANAHHPRCARRSPLRCAHGNDCQADQAAGPHRGQRVGLVLGSVPSTRVPPGAGQARRVVTGGNEGGTPPRWSQAGWPGCASPPGGRISSSWSIRSPRSHAPRVVLVPSPGIRPADSTACQRPAAGGRITASGCAASNRCLRTTGSTWPAALSGHLGLYSEEIEHAGGVGREDGGGGAYPAVGYSPAFAWRAALVPRAKGSRAWPARVRSPRTVP